MAQEKQPQTDDELFLQSLFERWLYELTKREWDITIRCSGALDAQLIAKHNGQAWQTRCFFIDQPSDYTPAIIESARHITRALHLEGGSTDG